jgi:hypothetical protein
VEKWKCLCITEKKAVERVTIKIQYGFHYSVVVSKLEKLEEYVEIKSDFFFVFKFYFHKKRLHPFVSRFQGFFY